MAPIYSRFISMYSPRVQGWSYINRGTLIDQVVFPAHARVFLNRLAHLWRMNSIPRACGVGPWDSFFADLEDMYSPRMRG